MIQARNNPNVCSHMYTIASQQFRAATSSRDCLNNFKEKQVLCVCVCVTFSALNCNGVVVK